MNIENDILERANRTVYYDFKGLDLNWNEEKILVFRGILIT